MAVTISMYNQTAKLLLNKEVTLTTLKAMLLNNSATFTAANTTKNQVSNTDAYQVSGNGWASGGVLLANVAVSIVTTNDAKLDADDIDVTAAGGAIGPAYKAVIYDSTSGACLFFIDFGAAKTADAGANFLIIFDPTGILVGTVV